jgi:hypothetical protein
MDLAQEGNMENIVIGILSSLHIQLLIKISLGQNWRGEEIEWEIFSLPVSDSLIHNLSPKLRDAQLLFDTNKIGEEIIGRVNERLKKGLPESSRTIEKHVSAKSFVVSKLGRMIDTQNDMEMYIKYSSVFYLKMVNNWYNFLHYEYSKNLYNALPEIETRDPVFRKMIHDFIFGSPVQQIEVGRQMISHIFKN